MSGPPFSPRELLVRRRCPGNLHALIKFRNDDELKAVEDAVHRLVHRVVALDGTCKCCSHRIPALVDSGAELAR